MKEFLLLLPQNFGMLSRTYLVCYDLTSSTVEERKHAIDEMEFSLTLIVHGPIGTPQPVIPFVWLPCLEYVVWLRKEL